MRFPVSWLNDLLMNPVSPTLLEETLTRIGLEVESLEYRAPGLETVVVGQITHVDAHPNADKLRICQTDIGDGQPLQIVTGAPNVKLGDKIPVALVGSNLPGNKKIEAAKLRGVDSAGMYCSLAELGLPPGEDGVLILPTDTPLGQPIAAAMKLGELVLDVAVTANRPDLLSVIGVARELAVALPDSGLKLPAAKPQTKELALEAGKVKLGDVDAERCPVYLGLNMTGVKVGPSPDWLVKRLEGAGMRAINNVVDATNYVMLLTGQPLHAFDTSKIKGHEIRVRKATEGETLVTLDGQKRTLQADDLVIADAERALVVAGVMGGADAEVDANTTELFLEAAYFSPSGVRKTGRRLGLSTESSYRFERGVNPSGTGAALALLRETIASLAGGEAVGAQVEARKPGFPEPRQFTFRLDAIKRLLGLEIPNQEVERVVSALGFSLHRHSDGVFELSSYDVSTPGWRYHDVTREADLVEEVARHYGYDRIPTVLPPVTDRPRQPAIVGLEARARAVAAGLGLSEVMTKSLTTPEAERLAGLAGVGHIALANAVKEMSVLRTSLLPSLLEVLRYNRYQGQPRLGIFEIGKTYGAEERLWLGATLVGSLWEGMWLPEQTPAPLQADFYYAKGLVEKLMQRLELEGTLSLKQVDSHPTLHPGRQAELLWNDEVVGSLGELHPQVAKDYDLPGSQKVSAFTLDLTKLALLPRREARFEPFSRLPAALRDLAVVVGVDVAADDAIKAIREAGGELLEDVTLFDRFTGGNLPDGKVSLGFSLVYRAPDRTLGAGDVEPQQANILKALEDRFGAVLRG
ncbi:MAG: phenylalanine--tRNA ligase subunit beta [Cyanobacteria bacterium RYN_339]|nr:phenylalanine--tRNA ligase subunit beta [Cyanobacteria bacterium RYN_339]